MSKFCNNSGYILTKSGIQSENSNHFGRSFAGWFWIIFLLVGEEKEVVLEINCEEGYEYFLGKSLEEYIILKE